MTYLMTLPIKRKTYVTEKYLFAMALAGAGSLLILILELLYHVIRHRAMTEVVMWEILSSTCFMIPVVILFLALALPLNLKFGSEKGRSLFSGMMLGFFLSGIVGVKKLKGFITAGADTDTAASERITAGACWDTHLCINTWDILSNLCSDY